MFSYIRVRTLNFLQRLENINQKFNRRGDIEIPQMSDIKSYWKGNVLAYQLFQLVTFFSLKSSIYEFSMMIGHPNSYLLCFHTITTEKNWNEIGNITVIVERRTQYPPPWTLLQLLTRVFVQVKISLILGLFLSMGGEIIPLN